MRAGRQKDQVWQAMSILEKLKVIRAPANRHSTVSGRQGVCDGGVGKFANWRNADMKVAGEQSPGAARSLKSLAAA